MTKLYYISDLHLEFNRNFYFNFEEYKEDSTLCLLGDIAPLTDSRLLPFIIHCCSRFKNVIYVYGNHEFYNNKKKCIGELMVTFETSNLPSNLYILNNKSVYLNTVENTISYEKPTENFYNYVKLIGTTLWSDITKTAFKQMNDSNLIYEYTGQKLTYKTVKYLFNYNKNYILGELVDTNCKCIILTHHGLNELCEQKEYKNGPMTSAFVTDIKEIKYYTHNIIACINGHTHYNINTKIEGTETLLLSNCYGYPREINGIEDECRNKFLQL